MSQAIVSKLTMSLTGAILFASAAQASAPAQVPNRPVQLAQAQPAARQAQRPATRADIVRSTNANFARVDTNKDGSLSKAEIDAAQVRMQQQQATNLGTRIQQEFTKLDTDRNGQLSLAEFRAGAPARPPAAVGTASATAMQRLDTNKDGKISAEEYRAPMIAGFDRIDTNKDGIISTDERTKAAAAARTASRAQ